MQSKNQQGLTVYNEIDLRIQPDFEEKRGFIKVCSCEQSICNPEERRKK
jgi:hypothetical protein